MQINNINSTQTNFKSKFIPNKLLEKTFNGAAEMSDRNFALSIKTILNDRKNDILELRTRNKQSMDLLVNGESKEEGLTFLNYYGNVGSNLINKYAEKTYENKPKITEKYNNFSENEKKLVKENIELIKLLTDNFENGINFVESTQKELNKIKQKIDENAKQEIIKLKEIIFNGN